MKMKNNMKEEDEEKQKKLGVGGSPLHKMVLQSNGQHSYKSKSSAHLQSWAKLERVLI